MTYHSILQWNCRGIKANFNELHILLQECSRVCAEKGR